MNHTAAPAANADSDTVMVEDAAIDCDSVAMYVENKTEIFFGETVRYTGNVFTDPYPGRFYPCDNGKMILVMVEFTRGHLIVEEWKVIMQHSHILMVISLLALSMTIIFMKVHIL